MKYAVTLIFSLLVSTSFPQIKGPIKEYSIGTVEITYFNNVVDGDTIERFSLGCNVRNNESTHWSKYIRLESQNDLDIFIQELKKMCYKMGTKQIIEIKNEEYCIQLYDDSELLYLSHRDVGDMSESSALDTKQVKKLIKRLERIKFLK